MIDKTNTRAADSRQAPDGCTRNQSADDLVDRFAKLDRTLDKKKRTFAPIGNPLAVQRLSEIERTLTLFYGSILPDDDAGHDDLRVLVAAAKAAGKPPIGHVRRRAPWMSEVDANRLCIDVSIREAYVDADAIATRLGVTNGARQELNLRTIGAIDVNKAERERRRRDRYNAKRRTKAAAKPEKPTFTKREKAIMKMVGSTLNMSDLVRKAGRHQLFRGLENVPHAVRRVVKKLVKSGHLGSRLEPRRERSRREYFLWNEHKAKAEVSEQKRAKAENAPPKTPIFTGSSRGASVCVNSSEGAMEKRGAEKWDQIDGPAEPAPPTPGLRRRSQPEPQPERRVS